MFVLLKRVVKFTRKSRWLGPKGLVVSAIAVLIGLGLFCVAYTFVGHRLIKITYEHPSAISDLLMPGRGTTPLVNYLAEADEMLLVITIQSLRLYFAIAFLTVLISSTRRIHATYVGCFFAVVLIGLLIAAITQDIRLPLWTDEILTFYVSQQPTILDVVSAIREGVDSQPPFYDLIVRALRSVVSSDSLLIRLPSTIGFFLMCVCIFVFVRKHVPSLYAMLAALTVVRIAWPYAFEGRVYGIELGCISMALICWQTVDKTAKARTNVGLAISLAAAIAFHYFAALVICALFAGELIRSWKLKKIYVGTLTALMVPLLMLPLHLPLIRAGSPFVKYFWSKASRTNLYGYYADTILPLMDVLFFSLVWSLYIGARRLSCSEDRRLPVYGMWKHAWVGLILLSEIVILTSLLRANVFVGRYLLWSAFVICAFFACELIRSWKLKKTHVGTLSALILPLLILPLHLQLFGAGKPFVKYFWSKNGLSTYSDYVQTILPLVDVLLLCLVLLLSIGARRLNRSVEHQRPVHGIWKHEWAVALGLILMPEFVILASLVTVKVFAGRYVLWSAIGVGICLAVLLHRLVNGNRIVASLVMLPLLFWSIDTIVRAAVEPPSPRYAKSLPQEIKNLSAEPKPIVITSLHAFMELWFYAQPDLQQRLVYLVSPDLELQYANTDTTSRIMSALRRRVPLSAIDYDAFMTANSRFIVAGDRDDWISLHLRDLNYRLTPLEGRKMVYEVYPPSSSSN